MKARARVEVSPKKRRTNGRTSRWRMMVAKPFMIIFMILMPFLGSNTPFRFRQHNTSNRFAWEEREREGG